ncbi:hypothetical protein ACCAA_890004 [Candidatus Accumulibacter aalborgensis]|uniref:Uncharacterized protein n=1 Tax=Candidatus Accumulibacter aalborgensis TaxID=1860102 RepID=A0A1A8XYU2_9PROT|nr:hypothetical protein ACCAA_890004 [Candidatus Accumulibacter aalborgensis]
MPVSKITVRGERCLVNVVIYPLKQFDNIQAPRNMKS